jgi:hypothetical protein
MSGWEWGLCFIQDCLFTSLKTFIGSGIIGLCILIPVIIIRSFTNHD